MQTEGCCDSRCETGYGFHHGRRDAILASHEPLSTGVLDGWARESWEVGAGLESVGAATFWSVRRSLGVRLSLVCRDSPVMNYVLNWIMSFLEHAQRQLSMIQELIRR